MSHSEAIEEEGLADISGRCTTVPGSEASENSHAILEL